MARWTAKPKDASYWATEAARAHTDLNIFAAVVSLLEGGHVSSDVQPFDFRIIRLAQQAQQRCLKRYDDAVARANSP